MDMAGEIDARLFLLINRHLVHPALDDLMVFLTTFRFSSHLFLLAALFILIRRGRGGFGILAVMLLAVGIADYSASGILKPLVQRIRPCFVLDGVRLLIDQSRSFSFASSHAANTAAIAASSWIFFRNGEPIERLFMVLMACYAFLVAYSRIYVGVHYPGDVIGGMIIGCGSALLSFLLLSWLFKNVIQPLYMRNSRDSR